MGLYEIKKMTTLRDELRLIQAKSSEKNEKAVQAYMPRAREILVAAAKEGRTLCVIYSRDLTSKTARSIPDAHTVRGIVRLLKKEKLTVVLALSDEALSSFIVCWE